jgi:hypothetical protein
MNDDAEPRTVASAPEPDADEPLLLDRIDALRVLRASSPEEKGALLEELGGSGKVEQDIVNELSKVKPLWRVREFPEAHRMAMRSLEVLDRNGARNAQLPPLGPITPIAQWVVQLITRWIVKGYQNTLVTHIRKLYERREANSIWGSDEHSMLRRARLDATRVEQGFKGNPVGIPTFLLGGAFVTTAASTITNLIRSALDNDILLIGLGVVFALLLLALSWAALYSAAVARRRIRLTTQQPIQVLYDVIGAAGDPPKDQSYNFAVIAIVLLILSWVVVPPVVYAVFFS